VTHRQCDEDDLGLVCIDVCGQFAEAPKHSLVVFDPESLGAAIVEEPVDRDTKTGIPLQPIRQGQADLAVAGENGRAYVAARMHQTSHRPLEAEHHEDQWKRRQHGPGQDDAPREVLGELRHVADREQHRQQEGPAHQDAGNDLPPTKVDLQGRQAGRLKDDRPEDPDQHGEHREMIAQLRAEHDQGQVQHPDRNERRCNRAQERQGRDRKAALEYNGFGHLGLESRPLRHDRRRQASSVIG
jgi:hypothetical protein